MSGRALSIILVLLVAVGGVSALQERRGLNWVDVELSDGRHILSVYPSPVSYWNGTAYLPLDTRIKHSAGKYYVERGIYRARWNSSGALEVERGRHRLRYHLNLLDTRAKRLSLKPVLARYSGNRLRFMISSYIESEYMYFPTRVKHNIILKSPLAVRGKALRLRGYIELSPGLEVYVKGSRLWRAINTSQPVEFRYRGERVFTLLPPLIYDSGNASTLGRYELRVTGRKVLLTLSVPADWLKNSSRVYPVTIDPVIKTENPGDDAYVAESTGLGYNTRILYVQSALNTNLRSFIKFPLPSTLDGVYQYSEVVLHREDGTDGRTLELYYVEDDSWSEDTINWHNQPASSLLVASQVMSGNYVAFSGTELNRVVEQELSSGNGNISFMLKDSSENSQQDSPWQVFTSSEGSSYSYYLPALRIYYNEPLDNDHWRYADLATPATFKFTAGNMNWAAVGIRNTDGKDHDIKVDDEIGFSWPYKASALSGTTPDFVVINTHRNSGFKDYYARVYYNTGGNNHGYIEAEFYQDSSSNVPGLTVNRAKSGRIDASEVFDLYEVYLHKDKSYKITLDITSGYADLDLFVFDYSHTMASRSDADSHSDNDISGSAGDEIIESFSPSQSGYAAIVVVHDGTSDASTNWAEYTILVEEVQNNPPTKPVNPSPANGATDVPTAVTLSWQGGDDPDGDSVIYDVYLEAEDSTPDVLACQDITAKSCYVTNLSHSTTYYWKVIAEDEHGATAESSVWSFKTTSGGGGGGSNPDGDDLTTEEENSLPKVCDKLDPTNCFPDPEKYDALLPVTAAKLYYNQRIKNKDMHSLASTSKTHILAYYTIFLSELTKHVDDANLKNRIKQQIKILADEIMRRQYSESTLWSNKSRGYPYQGESLDLKGFIHPKTLDGFNPDEDFDYFYGNEIYISTGYGGMALLLAGEALGNQTYIERGRMAADFMIRWHETRGFDSDADDDYCCYWDRSSPEAQHHGGDEYDSTANTYGCSLMVVSHAGRLTGGFYSPEVPGSDMYRAGAGGSYTEIAEWMTQEIRRLQIGKTGINAGGIRTGPLDGGDPDRLNEHIHYAGMTSFGVRQVYDVSGSATAYSVVRDLAAHYWRIYNFSLDSDWFEKWSFERRAPVGSCLVTNDERAWAATIELAGDYTYGFRQAVFDSGGILAITDRHILLNLYQAMKMQDNPYVVYPAEIALNRESNRLVEDCTKLSFIHPGEKHRRSFRVAESVDSSLRVVLSYQGSELSLVLYTPDGRRIDPEAAQSDPTVEYVDNGTLKYYTIRNPDSGEWKLEVTAVDVPAGGEPYTTSVLLSSSLGLSVEPESYQAALGESLRITAWLLNGSTGVSGARVTARVVKPNGEQSVLVLADNGDGEYSGVFTETSLPGSYRVLVEASGRIGGEEFNRYAAASFEVYGEGSRKEGYIAALLPPGSLSPGDTLSALIYVENTGTAEIEDSLLISVKDSSGKTVHVGRIPVYLEPGEARFVKYRWRVQENSKPGKYTLKVEFGDADVDALPVVKVFRVES